jgi:uncharacterized protein (TIGR02391 family)
MPPFEGLIAIASTLASEFAEYARPRQAPPEPEKVPPPPEPESFDPDEALLAEYDRRIRDPELRTATRSRFVVKHYSDAVEAGVKALNECVRRKSGSVDDGDSLMTTVFSPNDPVVRINKGRSKSDISEQRGHMQMCQGVVAAWRNPRAHSSQFADTPERALSMLETIDGLIAVTKAAVRTRKKRAP